MSMIFDIDHLHLTEAQVLSIEILIAEEKFQESVERARRYLETGEESA